MFEQGGAEHPGVAAEGGGRGQSAGGWVADLNTHARAAGGGGGQGLSYFVETKQLRSRFGSCWMVKQVNGKAHDFVSH